MSLLPPSLKQSAGFPEAFIKGTNKPLRAQNSLPSWKDWLEFKHTHSSTLMMANRPERASLIDLMKQELLSIKLSEALDVQQGFQAVLGLQVNIWPVVVKETLILVTSPQSRLLTCQVRKRQGRFLRQPGKISLRAYCSLKCVICFSISPNSCGDGAFISPSAARLNEQQFLLHCLGCKIMTCVNGDKHEEIVNS